MDHSSVNYTSSMGRVKSTLKGHMIPLAVLLGMIIVAGVISPAFFTPLNLKNIFIQQSMNMVVSLGMFVVIVMGGIDLSVGSIVAVTGLFCASFLNMMPALPAVVLALLVALALGTVNGLIVAKVRIAPFIVTLGMQSFASGIAYWYSKSSPISWNQSRDVAFLQKLSTGELFGIPNLAVIAILMIIIVAFMMNKTHVGRIIYATGGNEEAVYLSGIDISLWKIVPYMICGLCAGLGGIILMLRLGLGAPTSGGGLELDCIAAVVIGGTSFNGGKGTVLGVIIGVLILSIITNILNLMNVSSYPQLMLKGAIIVAAVIMSTLREKNA